MKISFHSFMFGDSGGEAKADLPNDEERSKSTEEHADAENHFSRDDWFFGERNRERGKENRQHEYSQIDELSEPGNKDELMKNIDDLFNSISQIKPLWRQKELVFNKWMKN